MLRAKTSSPRSFAAVVRFASLALGLLSATSSLASCYVTPSGPPPANPAPYGSSYPPPSPSAPPSYDPNGAQATGYPPPPPAPPPSYSPAPAPAPSYPPPPS